MKAPWPPLKHTTPPQGVGKDVHSPPPPLVEVVPEDGHGSRFGTMVVGEDRVARRGKQELYLIPRADARP